MYQKVILIGRVGQKQLGYTKTQKPVAQYSLATTKSFKDSKLAIGMSILNGTVWSHSTSAPSM